MVLSRVSVFIVLAVSSVVAQSIPKSETDSGITIVAIRENGVDLKLTNKSDGLISLLVCDNPRRLHSAGFHLEWFSREGWKKLEPYEGMIPGDLPPKYLNIKPGESVFVPAHFGRSVFGITEEMELRFIVTAWRVEVNPIGIVTHTKAAKLVSPSFYMNNKSKRTEP